jgi:hypothetical protein
MARRRMSCADPGGLDTEPDRPDESRGRRVGSRARLDGNLAPQADHEPAVRLGSDRA